MGRPTDRMALGRRALFLAALVLALAVPAQAAAAPVSSGFYGVNFQRMNELGPAGQDTHLARIASLGINHVRFNASWAGMEPVAPENGVHTYRWGAMDQQIASMARRGIRPHPTLTQTPGWHTVQNQWVQLQCAKASSRAPVNAEPYARFVTAYAQRYGRNGGFWAANPSLPYMPVLRYEIWNEPNLKGGWCPRPQPWLFADLFVGAARAIRNVDPDAKVMTGGVAAPAKPKKQYLAIADFFGKATARQRGLTQQMDAVAVHVYPPLDGEKQLDKLATFRSQLHAGRIPDGIPMVINEVGWATHVGKVPITEAERASAYGKMTVNYARTNCNVGGIFAHSWTSPQRNQSNPEDWYGIANPSTGAPYESARAFSYGVRLMTGQLSTPPPAHRFAAC